MYPCRRPNVFPSRYDGRDYHLNPFVEKNEKNWSPFEYIPTITIINTNNSNSSNNTTIFVTGTNSTLPPPQDITSPQESSPQMLFIYSIVPHRILALAEDVTETMSRTATTRISNIIAPSPSLPSSPITNTITKTNTNTNTSKILSLSKQPMQTQSSLSKERRRLKASPNHHHNHDHNHDHNKNNHNHHNQHLKKTNASPPKKVSHTSIKTQYTMVRTIALTEPNGKNQPPNVWERKWGRIRGGSPALRLPILRSVALSGVIPSELSIDHIYPQCTLNIVALYLLMSLLLTAHNMLYHSLFIRVRNRIRFRARVDL